MAVRWGGVFVAPGPSPDVAGTDILNSATAALGATADGMVAMQEALATYLAALGTLASDGVLPYREDPFTQLAVRAAVADDAGGRAVAALGAFLRKASRANMQAPEMRDAVVEADPLVQALVAALSATLGRSSSGEAADRVATATFYAGLECAARDRAARQAARDLVALRDREFASRALMRARYWAVLAEIGAGHALLKARARHISQEETIRQVRAAEDRLHRAAALLPQALLAPVAVARHTEANTDRALSAARGANLVGTPVTCTE
jgi:hypothetical protein